MKMLLLSAGKGPKECAYAVGLALKRIQQECDKASVRCSIIEIKEEGSASCLHHVILSLEGDNENAIANSWVGSMLWVCQSPFRKNHKRKNWYFSGKVIGSESSQSNNPMKDVAEISLSDIDFSFCRASGAGGQHVNKTDSAVRAVHKPSCIQVRVETERSQRANKRMAVKLLEYKLTQEIKGRGNEENRKSWQAHQNLERGKPMRSFEGLKFIAQSCYV